MQRDWAQLTYVQKRYFRYRLIYCINIYVLSLNVVEMFLCRGARSWWGGRLACMGASLVTYVR
jgi:hypothetical protein